MKQNKLNLSVVVSIVEQHTDSCSSTH